MEATDFLDTYQIMAAEKWLRTQGWTQVLLTGGIPEAERKIAVFYPAKLVAMVEEQPENILASILTAIHIQLPKDVPPYGHQQYLGALMKLGVKREKIGDIVVGKQGADILIKKEIEPYLLQALPQLTRFSQSTITSIPIEQIEWQQPETILLKRIVPSLRLDACIAEVIGCSRAKAVQMIEEQRVWLNGELQYKRAKEIREQDRITVRGKGRFRIVSAKETTKKGNIVIEIEKNV